MKKITPILQGAFMCLGLAFTGNVFADGSHGVKINFESKLKSKSVYITVKMVTAWLPTRFTSLTVMESESLNAMVRVSTVAG